MANFEESSPLLPNKKDSEAINDSNCSTATVPASAASAFLEKKPSTAAITAAPFPPPKEDPGKHQPAFVPMGWTAGGLPVGHSVMGEPVMCRAEWDSGVCSCLGRNDEFCSSDLEVCLLGSVAPCVLYGSNVERIRSDPGSFSSHCLHYAGLYLIGSSCFGWNCLAPWFSSHSRTAIRRKFNLEGSCEGLARSFGWSSAFVEDEMKREQCESACDIATHVFCHACALCQEAREVRRRVPHPGFNSQPILMTMVPPGEQTMGR
ncbi:unnamed protein product [Cuscuta epithymum]|uniref:Cell number regulator 8 n=1 Tax=Cuscuta epithymum TaxID=186058 RepID=A0AAV0F8C8_9ASTE|nr:unnamed protein product [Cuscuta epithymum]